MSKYSSFYQGAHYIDSLGFYQMMKGLLISNMFYTSYFFIDDLYYFGSDIADYDDYGGFLLNAFWT